MPTIAGPTTQWVFETSTLPPTVQYWDTDMMMYLFDGITRAIALVLLRASSRHHCTICHLFVPPVLHMTL